MAATWDVSTREPARPGTAPGAEARRRLVVRSRGSWFDPGRGGRRPHRAGGGQTGCGAAEPLHGDGGPRRDRAPRARRRLDRVAPAGLDTGTAAGRGPGHPACRGVGAAARRRRARAGRRRRGGGAGQRVVHRRLARVRQRGAGPGDAGDTADPGGRSSGSSVDDAGRGRGPRRRRTIEPWRRRVMSRLELRVLIAGILAATVILGAVMCAAYGQASIAAALSIYALGGGAGLFHSVARLVLARRIETVRSAATPLRPLLPVMAAIMALTQAVVRSLSDVTEVAPRRWIPITRGRKADDDFEA